MDDADYEILERVYRTFVAPQTSKKPSESDDSYRERIRDTEGLSLQNGFLVHRTVGIIPK